MFSVFAILRVVHIVAGALWVGGSVIHAVFIGPAAKATMPESQRFVQHLMAHGRFSLFMNVTSALTVLAGAFLFWRDSGGLQWPWITSGPGLTFTFGSIIGFAVYGIGFFMIRPRAQQLAALGQAVAAAGGPPTATQVQTLTRLDHELETIGRVDFILLIVALLAMAAARYMFF